MKLNIAFNDIENKEILLYKKVKPKNDKIYIPHSYQLSIAPIGTLLTYFLNVDFDDDTDFVFFIYEYCFPSLYFKHYGKRRFYINEICFPKMEFYNIISHIADEEKIISIM